ncbi:MAG TPA: hypothetical protein VF194_14245 [Ferrovibrio sp.]|jgi:hypothetical protein|uniref:hypothetical protein n=1 Tax=Ferrovibrio sp. TaxID=1917215 RepID=UPI002ED1DEC5
MVSTGIASPILAPSHIPGQTPIASQPLGGRLDSIRVKPASDGPQQRRKAGAGDFTPDLPDTAAAAKPRRPGTAAGPLPLLRRRTDRGEPADASIQIPPHLERRRAWREAFGLNTFHTQQLAQAETEESSGEIRNAGALAYRRAAWHGRLDLDLAQAVSVTV